MKTQTQRTKECEELSATYHQGKQQPDTFFSCAGGTPHTHTQSILSDQGN